MTKSLSTILLIAAIAIGIIAYSLAKIKVADVPKVDLNSIVADESFTDMHYASVKVDSFEHLLKISYPGIITIDRSKSNMDIVIKNANQLGGDFYNNNEKLLSFQQRDHGFKISHDKKNGSVEASFAVRDEQVTVPNDVLITLAYKVLNRPSK